MEVSSAFSCSGTVAEIGRVSPFTWRLACRHDHARVTPSSGRVLRSPAFAAAASVTTTAAAAAAAGVSDQARGCSTDRSAGRYGVALPVSTAGRTQNVRYHCDLPLPPPEESTC